MSNRHPHAITRKTNTCALASTAVGLAVAGGSPACKRIEPSSSTQAASNLNIDKVPVAPVTIDRDFMCPTAHSTLDTAVDGVPLTYQRSGHPIAAAWNALTPIVEDALKPHRKAGVVLSNGDVRLAVILVRRVSGVPHFLYLGNGTQEERFQPWSSSKHMAFAALGSKLREKSNLAIGLDGDVLDPNCKSDRDPEKRFVPIGDLITTATLYRDLRLATNDCRSSASTYALDSNNVSTWAKNAAGRAFNNDLVRRWLGRPNERFDGAYARFRPEYWLQTGHGFGYAVTGRTREGIKSTVTLEPMRVIPYDAGNSLSAHTMAEFLKRLVLHREMEDAQRVPYLQWVDVMTLLYGATPARTRYFSDLPVGGMQGGSSTFIEAALGGSKNVDTDTRGQWRTFTKIGAGPNDARGGMDFVWQGYGCMPRFDEYGRATNRGKEFFISVSIAGHGSRPEAAQDAILTSVVRNLVAGIMDGRIDRTNFPVDARTTQNAFPSSNEPTPAPANTPLTSWDAEDLATPSDTISPGMPASPSSGSPSPSADCPRC